MTRYLAAMAALLAGCGATIHPSVHFHNEAPPPRRVYVERPAPPVVQRIEAPSGHSWVYYPESNCYVETRHRVYVIEREGRWVTSTRAVAVRGPRVAVEYNGPRPWLYVEVHRARHRGSRVVVPPHHRPAGHSWVYYPETEVYYSSTLRCRYERRGSRWVRLEGPAPRGRVVTLDYNGPQPYLYIDVHRQKHGRRHSAPPSRSTPGRRSHR